MIRLRSSLSGLASSLLLACAPSAPPTPPLQAEPAPPQVDARYVELPTPTAPSDWAPPAVSSFTLPNGLRIWHLTQANAELVSIHVVMPVGSSSDPRGKEGLMALSADLLDEGAGKRSSLELSDALGLLATDYQATAGLDYVLLSMNALADNFEASAEILADIVRRPKLDRAEFQRRKEQHLAQAIARSSSQSSLLSAAYHRVLFGEGYAGSLPEGTKASLDAITLQDVKQAAASLNLAEGSHIVVVGGVDQGRARAAVQKAFGDWKGKRKPVVRVAESVKPDKTAYVVPFPGAAQSSLAVLMRAGGSADPNYFAELVLNRPLGEAFTSRINLNLREDKGYTYGAFSSFRRYRHAGYFGVVANVKSDVTAASVKEIFKELAELCTTKPLTDLERNEAVEGLLLGYPLRFERVDEIGMQVASLPIYDRPENFWQTWPDQVRSITRPRASEAATPYCDPTHYQVVVAGDIAVVRPGLEALGLKVTEVARPSASPAAAPAPPAAADSH